MMHNHMSNVSKGIIAGVVAGAAIGMIAAWPSEHRRHSNVKKNANKAIHAVGELVQNVQYMMH
ncbi:MAG TPA: hypothetical protein DEP42_04700 [Ruminococcaceae bacterium]|nr:hypothetical protein [Oscillospiraceae bacterium]